MKRKIEIFILTLVLILAFGIYESVSACSCLRTVPCQSLGSADTVFVGKVVGAKHQKTVEDYSDSLNPANASPTKPKTVTYDVGEIYFEVAEAFAGTEKGARITIYSTTGGGDCGYWFQRGENYLVYASKENSNSSSAISSYTGGETAENLTSAANRLWTTICSGTKPLTGAVEDLKYLRSLSPNESNARIFGSINEVLTYRKNEEAKPFGNIKIRFGLIGGEEKFYETTTDSGGNYEIKLPSNRYEIIPVLPDYAQIKDLGSDKSEIEVKANACAQINLTIQSKSKITGKLISADGQPVFDSTIEVINLDTKEWAASDDTDEQGNFSIEGIAAGKYFIAINREMSPHAGSPYPTYYFPNSLTPEKAKIFTIGLGQNIENIAFQLPPKLKEQTISGKVFWENGKPAADTRVEIDDAGDDSFFRAERVTETDASGNFMLKGFIGRSYTLKAEFRKYEDLTEEQAKKEAILSGKITVITGIDSSPRYTRITEGKAEIKEFKVGNKPITFKIILKEDK